MPAELLASVAHALAEELGPPHYAQRDYAFPVFRGGSVDVRWVDAAVFSSPSPSVATALCSLSRADERGTGELLDELGQFGSPLAVVQDDSLITAYRFVAPRVPRQIDQVPVADVASWTRSTLAREVSAASQLELPLSEGRDVLISDARRGFSRLVTKLLSDFAAAGFDEPAAAFSAVFSALRAELFDEDGSSPELRELVRPYRDALWFPHVPLEAVAELYETLGLDARERRERGIAYTPAWIADHLVRRLPSTAFFSGRAVDPTCGSGTFLVAFLDRLVTERARRHLDTTATELIDAIAGVDIDAVALVTSRLTLDLFAHRLGHPPQKWCLAKLDATSRALDAAVLIGNLPFGYRTHAGKDDVSSVILRQWLTGQAGIQSLALLLPDSFAYAGGGTAKARAELRGRFRIDELIELPEEAFERTAAATLAVIAHRGDGHTPIVRKVRRQDLPSFRVTGVAARSFAAKLPPGPSDPWLLTPFFSVLERVRSRSSTSLGAVASIHLGFQAYGSEVEFAASGNGPRVLEDPKQFVALTRDTSSALRTLLGPVDNLRRSGPVELYESSKVLVRTTTNRHQVARLAALPDDTGLWFTDKFIGIWPSQAAPSPRALAAYLQTAIGELWLIANNPSRKLRIGTLKRLPVPELPSDWWDRASALAVPGQATVSARWRRAQPTLLEPVASDDDWRWFEQVVATSFGVTLAELGDIEQYLNEQLTIGRLD